MTIMGKVAYTVLVAFIASILTLLAVNWLAPDSDDSPGSAVLQPSLTATVTTRNVVPGSTATVALGSSPNPASPSPIATNAPDDSAGITLEQVSIHDSASSCWIVVSGTVYDVTSYLGEHPADYDVLLAWCGKEATQAYADKGGEGDDHSARADALLAKYEIGPLAP